MKYDAVFRKTLKVHAATEAENLYDAEGSLQQHAYDLNYASPLKPAENDPLWELSEITVPDKHGHPIVLWRKGDDICDKCKIGIMELKYQPGLNVPPITVCNHCGNRNEVLGL